MSSSSVNKAVKDVLGVDPKYLIVTHNKIRVDTAQMDVDGVVYDTRRGPFSNGSLWKSKFKDGEVIEHL